MRNIPRERRFSNRTLLAYTGAGLPETLAVRAAANGQPAEILLYDEIGPWGVTAGDFAGALKAAGSGPVRVRINSPGGDVFDGLAIYSLLLQHPGEVTATVDGLAASAASFIALAAGKVEMGESSMLMIHNAWGVVIGNRNDMRSTASTLDKIDGQLAAIYAAKTGKPVADMAALMDAETWLTAQEAQGSGFADSVLPKPERKDAKQALAGAMVIRTAAADAPPAPAAAETNSAAEEENAAALRQGAETRRRLARLAEAESH